MERRALVAGSTGYLGGHVVRELKKRGWWVRALARNPAKLESMRASIDDVFKGEIVDPETLARSCDGVDVVFSALGITKQKGKVTFRDVDYQGNKNLLEVAKKSGVKKFVYTSVFNGRNLHHLAIVKAHEDFVEELEKSGVDYAVMRPTGYFSDMGEIFKMAQGGRVYLFGSGESEINPIDGGDLAAVCADAIDGTAKEIDVGGPEVFNYKQIGALAFDVLGKRPKFSSLPVWVTKALVGTAKTFSPHNGEVLAFLTSMSMNQVVAPKHGKRTLREHFASLAGATGKQPVAQGAAG